MESMWETVKKNMVAAFMKEKHAIDQEKDTEHEAWGESFIAAIKNFTYRVKFLMASHNTFLVYFGDRRTETYDE